MSRGRTHQELAETGVEIVEAGASSGLDLRLLGGVAVRSHLGPSRASYDEVRPVPDDVDLLAPRKTSAAIQATMTSLGYEPDERLIAWRGDTRHRYYCTSESAPVLQVDVFLGTPPLCHRIDLAGAWTQPGPALPPTLLLLTKLQIVMVNEKDLVDAAFLLLDCPPAAGAAEAAASHGIDCGLVTGTLRRDWGFAHTVLENLEKAGGRLDALPPASRATASERLAELRGLIEAAPKSLRCRLREKVGTRWQWYQDVEELVR